MQEERKHIKMVTIIIDRNKGRKLAEGLNEHGFEYHDAFLGMGTAPTELAAYLGVGEQEKVVLFTYLEESECTRLLRLLQDELGFDADGGGIAFSVPVNGVSSMNVLKTIVGL